MYYDSVYHGKDTTPRRKEDRGPIQNNMEKMYRTGEVAA